MYTKTNKHDGGEGFYFINHQSINKKKSRIRVHKLHVNLLSIFDFYRLQFEFSDWCTTQKEQLISRDLAKGKAWKKLILSSCRI